MFQLIPLLLPIFNKLIDGLIPDKIEADKQKVELQRAMNEIAVKELEHDASVKSSQAQVITAEAQSSSYAARNWRPHLMYLIMIILGYNWIIAPIIRTMGFDILITPIPQDMWTLLTIGVGGYIVGRSGERIADSYAQGKVDTAQAVSDGAVAKAQIDSKKFFDEYRNEFGPIKDQQTVDALNKILKRLDK